MTWIKPSFAWVLDRSGYASKHNQERILKIKISHQTLANLLKRCICKEKGGGSLGRIQWDPARDLFSPENKGHIPRKMLKDRAIQIGLGGPLSEAYVNGILEIFDVTDLAHQVGKTHAEKNYQSKMDKIKHLLPNEKIYIPHPQCEKEDLIRLKINLEMILNLESSE